MLKRFVCWWPRMNNMILSATENASSSPVIANAATGISRFSSISKLLWEDRILFWIVCPGWIPCDLWTTSEARRTEMKGQGVADSQVGRSWCRLTNATKDLGAGSRFHAAVWGSDRPLPKRKMEAQLPKGRREAYFLHTRCLWLSSAIWHSVGFLA